MSVVRGGQAASFALKKVIVGRHLISHVCKSAKILIFG